MLGSKLASVLAMLVVSGPHAPPRVWNDVGHRVVACIAWEDLTPATRDKLIEILKQHPVIGKRILEPCAGFQQYLPIVELHHENHDGTGYPWQLADSAIPIEARIVHVADAYDAMTTDRPYRRGMPHETAIDRLRASSGTQFDPTVITAVEQMCGRGWRGADDWRATQQHPGVVALVRALRPEEARKVAQVEDHQRS